MVLWLRQTTHDQEVVGSNPDTVYWMDVSNASYYIQRLKQDNKEIQTKKSSQKR
jgi:hypothetical protein